MVKSGKTSVILVLLALAFAGGGYAQELKSGAAVSPTYPSLGLDMQYYEVKYDPNNEEYMSYYKVIREKIMQKLSGLYRYHYRNGDVYLFFTLRSDGKLAGFDIDRARSAEDKTLIDIATTSLKRSSPFPPFPKGLSGESVSFNVVISFKEK